MITVSARICDRHCSAKNCSISILYGDHANPSNSFVFKVPLFPGIPIYEPVSGGGTGLIISAQGEASGVIFNDIAKSFQHSFSPWDYNR